MLQATEKEVAMLRRKYFMIITEQINKTDDTIQFSLFTQYQIPKHSEDIDIPNEQRSTDL